ncbi:MAG: GntR family transcriptional regulator [Pseudomonadota bacterium]
MRQTEVSSWQEIQSEVLERIRTRKWKPGELIPNETELAEEFGCARATVNRALRAVADAGLLDRRRKAGSRVLTLPERKAFVSIPILRKEIEAKGQAYSHEVLHSALKQPARETLERLGIAKGTKALELHTLHMADGFPYAYEERWINTNYLPQAANTDFDGLSANEWLVANAPYTEAELSFSASNATARQAEKLKIEKGTAIFNTTRRTTQDHHVITFVKLWFAPGYELLMTV